MLHRSSYSQAQLVEHAAFEISMLLAQTTHSTFKAELTSGASDVYGFEIQRRNVIAPTVAATGISRKQPQFQRIKVMQRTDNSEPYFAFRRGKVY